jgi:serine/threonine-protein kinase
MDLMLFTQQATQVDWRSTPQGDARDPDEDWLRRRVGSSVGCSHRVVRHLGSGGMGHVFLVEHVHLGAYAAIKVARPGSRSASALLAREARLLSRLNHPHVVNVLDWGQFGDSTKYMMMDYVNGLDLEAWLDSCGTLSHARVLRILEQLASAVDYLHAHGIVHSDIKPANLMVDPRGCDFIRLVDFSVAFQASEPRAERSVFGTPGYMAPEAWRGDPCDKAIDVYSVAALALELITGAPPYDPACIGIGGTAKHFDAPPLPSSRGLSVRGLDAVFARGLHSEPQLRFNSATDFVEALKGALQSGAPRELAGRFRTRSEARVARDAQASATAKTLRALKRSLRAMCGRMAMNFA